MENKIVVAWAFKIFLVFQYLIHFKQRHPLLYTVNTLNKSQKSLTVDLLSAKEYSKHFICCFF